MKVKLYCYIKLLSNEPKARSFCMDVRIRLLSKDAKVPTYATPGDAGLDLTAITMEMFNGSHVTYGTGIAVEIPAGYAGFLFPRSSIRKYDIVLANSVGVIDSGYRGEISLTFSMTEKGYIYSVGDKIGQLVVMPVPRVNIVCTDNLSDSVRGAAGFGSTGA